MRNDQYGYDASGNVTAILDLLPSNVGSRAMSYEGLDRLTTASAPNLWDSATYGYDALDNLTGTTITGGITARATVHNINATTNRLDSITGGPPGFNVSYGYDVRGNVTQRNGQVFEYDLGKRLKRAVGKATYTYDGFRRRVSVVGTDGVTRVQVYAQDGKLLYVAPSGGTATKYVYLRNHVLAEVTGAAVTYDHTDALGSPVAQTNAAGAVLSRTRYEPYGYIVAGTPRTIGFTGHVNDNDTTLVYMQQRYYDAFAGRFLGVDPVTTDANNGASFNRYAYANNSPYQYIDPDGRDAVITIRKDGGIRIVLPISFSGPGATAENINAIKNDISSRWSGTYNLKGVESTVSVSVVETKIDGKLNNIVLTTGPTSHPATQGASYVVGGDSGEWNVNSKGMRLGEAAHEAGHLMGASDKYSSGTDADGKRSTMPNGEFAGNLMGQVPGRPDHRNINEILSNNQNVIRIE